MSHEPYPRTDRAMPGSTPAEHTPSDIELESDDDEESAGTPPDETVPDEVAERAARSEDPRTSPSGGDHTPEDPLHDSVSDSDVEGAPSGDV